MDDDELDLDPDGLDPDLPERVPPSDPLVAFREGVYREHLEEAGALYEQWRALRGDPEVTWLDIGAFEDRAEAHLDALVVGGEAAATACVEAAAEGDPGEAYAALLVFCRQGWTERAFALLDALDGDDTERAQAVTDALAHAMPDAWAGEVVARLLQREPPLVEAVAHLSGYRRLKTGEALLRLFTSCDPPALAAAAWALGRMGGQEARRPLYDTGLLHDDPAVRTAAAMALLRLGEGRALQHAHAHVATHPEYALPVGLGGSRAALDDLLRGVEAAPPPDGLLALGLLGDVAAVEPLLAALEHAEGAEAAAAALDILTGAGLTEEAEVLEPLDDDELFDDEQALLEAGEPLPDEAVASAPVTVLRLSQRVEDWTTWWAEHRAAFQPGVRYTRGVPATPAALVEGLRAERTPHVVRQLSADELAVRYGCPVAFDPDHLVAEQQRALDAMAAWVQERAGAWQPGRWYFAGQAYAR